MIVAILQARMSSSRLPGKVAREILQKPMVALQLERVKRSRRIDQIIMATSQDESDKVLIELSDQLDVKSYSGSLNDVLDRFYHAALPYAPSHIIRITGDCPIIDPGLIDRLVEFYFDGNYDYAGLGESFPDGLDVEIMSWKALSQAHQNAILPSEREHVTLYINNRPQVYRLGVLDNDVNYGYLRWTVDEKEDFELITKIYEALYQDNPCFTWQDVLTYVKNNPHLMQYNIKYSRNEGKQKSLLADKIFLKELEKHGSLSSI